MKATSITPHVLTALSLLGVAALPAQGQITRIVIERVESPAFGGRSFGAVGQYEGLVGRAIGEVDPTDPRNAGIVDIRLAPRNARGNVEYDVDLYILKPIDISRGNRTLYYEVNNRGGALLFGSLLLAASRPDPTQPTTPEHAGDGLLMRRGFTLVWSGWHADEPNRDDGFTVRFPVARNADGSPIRQWITRELISSRPVFSTRIGSDHVYAPVEASMPSARLLRRADPHGPDEEIPRSQWSFADCPDGQSPVPSKQHICLPSGFSTDHIYKLVYEAQDPFVSGLGFAATRDLLAFLRRDVSSVNRSWPGG